VIKKSKPYPTTKSCGKKKIMIKKTFKKMTKKIENTSKTLKNCQKNRKIQTEKNTSLKKKSMNGNKNCRSH